MAVLKKHLTPIGRHGTIHKHAGKGSEQAQLPDRRALSKLNHSPQSINDYAKATPMPQPMPMPMPGGGGGGFGNGM